MSKEELIELLWKILKANVSLHFLSKLEPEEIKTLIACVRDRIEKEKGQLPPRG